MKLSDKIWKERYALYDETCWEDTCERVARVASFGEEERNRDVYKADFFDAISKYNFIPGGRILSNAGKSKQYMMNCIVLALNDSRESIGDLLKETLIVSGTGGGVGVSFSKLRPKGASIDTCGGTSSGPISFMHCLDQVAATIKTGGGRRAALMISLSVYHPDIIEFLHEKLDLNKLSNANISVEIDNKFIRAVRNGDIWNTVWAGKVHSSIPARDIWTKLIDNAWKSGEPGILNLGLAKEYSNTEYYSPIATSNPCAEQLLPEYGACCLGSINIANFVREKNLDMKGFKQAIGVGVRFLDDIITVNDYPLDKIRLNATGDRRIGLGLMGLHYAMLKLGIKYSSKEGVDFTEKVYEVLRNHSYWTSTCIAEEKGAFSRFNVDAYLNNKFVKTLPYKIRARIREHGIRNVCLNTQAPTGTTSILAEVSSGIEPIFAPVYERSFFSGDEKVKEVVGDPLFMSYMEEGKCVEHFEGSHDIPPEVHIKVQEAAQQYIDAGISKTINLPKDFPKEKLSKLILDNISSLKGLTLYREGSRGDSPLKTLPLSAYKRAEPEVEIIECSIGGCE